MKISTKGRYGLRALLDLALHAKDESCTLTAIADRQQISVGYLEQIFSTLRKAGIVIGMKGPQGGYVLAQPPVRITVGSILEALEGDLFTVIDDPVDSSTAISTQRIIRREVWDRITQSAAEAIAGLTLGDLAEVYEREEMGGEYIYYI
jgi:Rrf2 family cysteine metabolism transcriptional repressor